MNKVLRIDNFKLHLAVDSAWLKVVPCKSNYLTVIPISEAWYSVICMRCLIACAVSGRAIIVKLRKFIAPVIYCLAIGEA